MGVPEKALFEDFIESFEWKIQTSEINNICRERLSKTSIATLLVNLDIFYAKHHNKMFNHDLNQWFMKQTNFSRAMTSIYKNYKKQPSSYENLEEYKGDRLNKIFDDLHNGKMLNYDFSSVNEDFNEQELLERANGDQDKFQILLTRNKQHYQDMKERTENQIVNIIMRWFKPKRIFTLHYSIYKIFYDYLYADRALKLYEAKIRSNKILRTLEANLEEFLKLKEFDQFLYYVSEKRQSHIINNTANRFQNQIKESTFIFPFERKDLTLKERVLIYDLHKLFNLFFKQSKPNAIFYLLMVEGIENNIEKRNIERMIAKWKTDI